MLQTPLQVVFKHFTYTITGSTGPLLALDKLALNQANFNTTDILCNGQENGAFTVEFTGGNPPYHIH